MTEQQWLACSKPELMLSFLKGKVSERKLHLFACACVRRVEYRLVEDNSPRTAQCKKALEVAERFPDRLATPGELLAAHKKFLLSRMRTGRAASLAGIGPGFMGSKPRMRSSLARVLILIILFTI
jgi:hypothetical protein